MSVVTILLNGTRVLLSPGIRTNGVLLIPFAYSVIACFMSFFTTANHSSPVPRRLASMNNGILLGISPAAPVYWIVTLFDARLILIGGGGGGLGTKFGTPEAGEVVVVMLFP